MEMVEFVRAAVLLATVASAYMLGSARCAAGKGKSLIPPLARAKVWYIVLAIALAVQYMQLNAMY